MQLSPEQIDWIVAEVVRRLRACTDASASSGTTLDLADRVVTLTTLDRRLDGVHCVQVSRHAVVTPAVRDLLRERQITLVREA